MLVLQSFKTDKVSFEITKAYTLYKQTSKKT